MEPRKDIEDVEKYKPMNVGPKEYFEKSLEFVKKFYQKEYDNIASVKFEDVTPEKFFTEYTWVVHATGFNAKVVGRMMGRLLSSYGNHDSLAEKTEEELNETLKICNNPQKIKAIWKTSKFMKSEIKLKGWERFKNESLSSPDKLQKLSYIGPVTCFHLARNIGILESVKPDLHLVRMAENWGFKSSIEMCEFVRPEGMPLGLVDLVLWYASSSWGTLEMKKEGGR